MAGVSLGLRKMFGSRSAVSQSVGYAYAGIAMAGPWLLTFCTLLVFGVLPFPGLTPAERGAFTVFVLYGHCGSMLLTGGLQLVAARHVSDQLFVGDVRRLAPTFSAASLVSLVLHAATGWLFAWATGAGGMLALAEVAF